MPMHESFHFLPEEARRIAANIAKLPPALTVSLDSRKPRRRQ